MKRKEKEKMILKSTILKRADRIMRIMDRIITGSR